MAALCEKMASENTEKQDYDVVAGCWDLAIKVIRKSTSKCCYCTKILKMYNKKLTKDPKKMIDQSTSTPDSTKVIDELIEVTQHAQKRHDGQQSPIKSKMEFLCKSVRQHRQSIDVLAQGLPDPASIIWASVRFLLDVGIFTDSLFISCLYISVKMDCNL